MQKRKHWRSISTAANATVEKRKDTKANTARKVNIEKVEYDPGKSPRRTGTDAEEEEDNQ